MVARLGRIVRFKQRLMKDSIIVSLRLVLIKKKVGSSANHRSFYTQMMEAKIGNAFLSVQSYQVSIQVITKVLWNYRISFTHHCTFWWIWTSWNDHWTSKMKNLQNFTKMLKIKKLLKIEKYCLRNCVFRVRFMWRVILRILGRQQCRKQWMQL